MPCPPRMADGGRRLTADRPPITRDDRPPVEFLRHADCHRRWRRDRVRARGDVIDILVQSRRNRRVAARFFRKLLKGQGQVPRRLITDQLRSYAAAHRTAMPSVVSARGSTRTIARNSRINRPGSAGAPRRWGDTRRFRQLDSAARRRETRRPRSGSARAPRAPAPTETPSRRRTGPGAPAPPDSAHSRSPSDRRRPRRPRPPPT